MVVTEIFYMGSGFGLYINSRIHLEGWDIEVRFRSLAERLQKLRNVASVLIFGLLGLFVVPVSTAEAAPREKRTRIQPIYPGAEKLPDSEVEDVPFSREDRPAVDRAEAKVQVEQILKHKDFTVHEHWEEKQLPTPIPDWFGNLLKFLAGLGPLASILFWVVLSMVVLFLLYIIVRVVKIAPKSNAVSEPTRTPVRTVAGLELSPDKLPTNIREAATQAMLEGNTTKLSACCMPVHCGGCP